MKNSLALISIIQPSSCNYSIFKSTISNVKQKTTFVYYQTCYTLSAVALFCSSQYFPCKESGATGVNIKHTLPFEFHTGSQANNYLAKISTKYSFLLLAFSVHYIITSTHSQCNKERKKKELF